MKNKIPRVFIDNQWVNVGKLPIFSPFLRKITLEKRQHPPTPFAHAQSNAKGGIYCIKIILQFVRYERVLQSRKFKNSPFAGKNKIPTVLLIINGIMLQN